MKLGLAYYRKSIKFRGLDQEEDGVSYQRHEVENFAKSNGIRIVKEFVDVGYTGTNLDRPDLQTMIYELETGKVKVDVLLFYSVDRLGRDLRKNIYVLVKALDYVEEVVFVSTELRSADRNHFKLIFLVESGVAQDTRRILLKRTAGGRQAKVLDHKNFHANYRPLGLTLNRQTKRLVPATTENTDDLSERMGLTMLQYIFFSFVCGSGCREIARNLNSRFGVTNRGKEWSDKSVRYVLSNPIYLGILSGTLEKIPYWVEHANVEPIIDPLLFDFVQTKLKLATPGRQRKVVLGRIPHFMVCMNCWLPVCEVGDKIRCSQCGGSADTDEISKNIVNQVVRFLGKSATLPDVEQQRRDLGTQYELKVKKIKSRILELKQRREEFESRNDIKPESKRRMIEKNTKEVYSLSKDLTLSQALLERLRAATQEELLSKSRDVLPTYLIRLPYLVLVNFTREFTVIVSHHQVLNLDRGMGEYVE